jgi:hypothetical protein
MSLAEDLPRSYAGSLSRPTAHKLSRVSLADLASRTVPNDGRMAAYRVADEDGDREPSAVVPLPRKTEKADPADPSLDLLDRASRGMSFILNRYKQLEEHVKQVDAWSNAQIQAAEAEAARCRDDAATAEKRLEECQRTLEIMVRRAEAAEQAMQHDRASLTVLQDRIIQAFGFGSEAHEAIAAGLDLG